MHPSEVPPLLAGTFDKAKHIDKMRAKGKSDQEIEVRFWGGGGWASVCRGLRAFSRHVYLYRSTIRPARNSHTVPLPPTNRHPQPPQ